MIFPTLFLSSPFLFTPYHIPVLLQLCLSFSSLPSFSSFSSSFHTPRPPLPLGFLVSSRRFFSFPIKIFHRNLFVCWPRLCFFSRTCLHFRRYGYRVPSFLAITNHPIRFSLVIHTTKSPLVSTIFCEARYRLILLVSFILSHHFFVSFAIQFVVLRSFILPIFLSLSSRVYFVSSFYRYLYVRYCSRCFVKFCSRFYDTDTVCCF